MRQFHHMGLPTEEKHDGEVFVEATKVWVTDPDQCPQKIEYLRFEPDATLTGPVRDMPHFAYKVDDMAAEMKDLPVLLGPFQAMENLRVVFVEENGAVIEFMEFSE